MNKLDALESEQFKLDIIAAWNRLDAVMHRCEKAGKEELAMEVRNMRRRMWDIFAECGGIV